MNLTEKLAAVESAVAKAEDRLAFLDRVPQADTNAARHAAEGLRLEILSQMRDDVSAALASGGRPVRDEPQA